MLDRSAHGNAGADNLLKPGREQTAATFKIQQDVLDAFEQTSRAWLARVQAEVELWSQLATKLSATHSVPEALGAYQESVTRRMQMAADDGKRLSSDCQEFMSKITRSLSRSWPSGSS